MICSEKEINTLFSSLSAPAVDDTGEQKVDTRSDSFLDSHVLQLEREAAEKLQAEAWAVMEKLGEEFLKLKEEERRLQARKARWQQQREHTDFKLKKANRLLDLIAEEVNALYPTPTTSEPSSPAVGIGTPPSPECPPKM